MGRGRIFRDRASYKASDVLALFLLGLVLGAISYGLLSLVIWLAQLMRRLWQASP